MTDPIAALILVLQADPVLGSLTSLVFGGELPEGQSKLMPVACVVLRKAGGPSTFGGGFQQFGDLRVDVKSYGSTPQEADQVFTAVRSALKHMPSQTQASTRLHWCRQTGGPLALRDSDTKWPYCMSSWQVLAGEIPATA